LGIEVDLEKVQKLELLKQHYRIVIEAKNKEFRENADMQERLRKQLNLIFK